MKKLLSLLMIFLLTGTLLAACKQQPTYSNKEEEICASYLDLLGSEAEGLTVDSFSVRYVYDFQEASAVFIDGGFGYTQVPWTETVNGLNFEFSNGQILYIYCNKQLYRIKEAFTKGILTENELTEFHQAHKKLYPNLYETE